MPYCMVAVDDMILIGIVIRDGEVYDDEPNECRR